jgi:hypothetical protein
MALSFIQPFGLSRALATSFVGGSAGWLPPAVLALKR